jgi:hypothetical protein
MIGKLTDLAHNTNAKPTINNQCGENVGGAENHFSSFVKVQISHRNNMIRELKLDLIPPNRHGSTSQCYRKAPPG